MEEELVKVVDASKEIIRKSVLGIFGEEALDKVDEALKSITFDIDKDPKIAEECSAYCRENEVYWTESSFNASIGRIQAISTTIHELSHAFSHLISKEKVNCIVEESIANLFAEMCINYYLQNETEFPYITKEELARLTKSGYKEENSYVKEGEFLRSVLFPLREQGKDIEAIKEYLFGKKSRFLTICEDVLGQKFSNVLDEMKDVRIYVGINETEKYLPKANSEMLNIIETFSEDLTKQEAEDNSINNEQGQLYVTYSPLLEYVSYLRSIRRFVEERKETFKIEDIDELYEQEYCTSRLLGIDYGVPNYIRNIINWWYEKSNGDMEKFGAISKIVLIPFEQIKYVLLSNKMILAIIYL